MEKVSGREHKGGIEEKESPPRKSSYSTEHNQRQNRNNREYRYACVNRWRKWWGMEEGKGKGESSARNEGRHKYCACTDDCQQKRKRKKKR